MSKSIPQATTCPLGKYCPHQPADPGTAHPPPEKWLPVIKRLQASSGAVLEEGAGKKAVGLYISLSDDKSYVIWQDENVG